MLLLQTITNDNFELGCTIIERSATDKAIRDINERLAPAFQARQKAAAAGQSSFDANVLQGRFPKALPEALRPKAGHMNPQQERVYEDFARIPKQPGTAAAVTGPAGLQSSGPGSPLKATASEKVSVYLIAILTQSLLPLFLQSLNAKVRLTSCALHISQRLQRPCESPSQV